MKMKAITAVCATGASVPAIVNGRVSRHHRDGENAEIQMYLSKLRDLVPYMPKNRKLSKLEIIQNVIDYICDLQSELETHPAINHFDASAALDNQEQINYQQQQQNMDELQNNDQMDIITSSDITISNESSTTSPSSSSPTVRQPLSDRPTPNTILSATHSNPLSSPTIVINGQQTSHSHAILENRSQC